MTNLARKDVFLHRKVSFAKKIILDKRCKVVNNAGEIDNGAINRFCVRSLHLVDIGPRIMFIVSL